MRSSQYIHALGRRSFEPSQPATSTDASQPTPAELAQERQRDLVKAQNDVLATVGVCLRATKNSIDNQESERWENDVGVLISAWDTVFAYVVSWPVFGVRNRLQVFRSPPELSYARALKLAWSTNSIRQHFAGLPAHITYQALKLLQDYMHVKLMRGWVAKTRWFTNRRKYPRLKNVCFQGIWYMVSFCSWTLVYPFFYHSNAQILHLTDASPLYPRLLALIPFSSASPLSLPVITGSLLALTTWKHLLLQAASSHLFQSYIFTRITISLNAWFSARISRLLPHPGADSRNNRDYSTDADFLEDQLEMTIAAGPAEAIEIEAIIPGGGDPFAAVAEPPQSRTYTATLAPWEAPPAGDPLYVDQEDSENMPPAPTAPVTPANGPASTSDQQNSSARQGNETIPNKHRTTALAVLPVDTLSMHIADCLCNATVLIWESAMLRSFARNVLAKSMTIGGESRINAMVYQPWERTGMGLIAKSLVMGDWGFNFMLFEISWGVCWFVGKGLFGYSKQGKNRRRNGGGGAGRVGQGI
ncbi:hypothetical protein EX30DRAFT_361015 [Ascodesmis nigricans]|uniref:Uncharacterized protein n=1 Tax=Ascodesmis nigricans TaxID=341454 RepID=A0A4S2N6Y7_9PEZI|nr:hypothetical protein EX30DRAFT_361015 [Ascodesmis nigricans]